MARLAALPATMPVLKTGVPSLAGRLTGLKAGGLSRARLRPEDQFAGGGAAPEEAVAFCGLSQG